MASTRQPPFMPIFHDPIPPQHTFAPMNGPRPRLQPSAMPLQPINNAPGRRPVVLDPPSSAPQQPSPLKTVTMVSPPRPIYDSLTYISLPPPDITNVFTDAPIKKLLPPARPLTQPATQKPLFTTFHSKATELFEQENYPPLAASSNNFVAFPDHSYDRRLPFKRSVSEMAPSMERYSKKPRQEDTAITHLPEPGDMPAVDDDGGKPIHSYAALIGMAILRAQNRRLTLAQIYKWISDTFAFYRGQETGWQNSIRHNLSLNKAFIKQERPKGDSGKGNYWLIEPGQEMQFVREKPSRKGNPVPNLHVQPQTLRQDASQPVAEALDPKPYLLPAVTLPRLQPAPPLPELSSDATLPASDPALQDDEGIDFATSLLSQAPKSSPPQAMNSSPPVGMLNRPRRGTHSPPRSMQASSMHKRRTTMDDSGYFSSIESSALKAATSAVVLTSELDIDPPKKKQKRGRAEEEIVRIRSSSITPSHIRFRSLGSDDLISSSPVRKSPASKLPPVTPHVVFKKPTRPPPSISPNTNLRNHRKRVQELVNSPIKSLGLFGNDDLSSYSPAFKIPDSISRNPFYDQFEVYSDFGGTNPSTPALGSPSKGSAKRPAFGRAATTASTLSDLTGGDGRLNAKSPLRGPTLKPITTMSNLGSPSKGARDDAAVLPDQEDLFDFGSFADENSDEGESVDILKGFQKIGGAAAEQATPPIGNKSKVPRPGWGAGNLTSLS